MASRADSRNDSYDNVSGLCYMCKTLCSNFCSRCGEWYCSLKCQKEDWKNHRYVCFKMPYLVMGPQIVNEPTNNNIKPSLNSRLHYGSQNGFHKTDEKFNGDRSLEGNLSLKSSTSSLSTRNHTEPKKMFMGDLPKNNEDVTLTWVSQPNSYYIRTCRSSSEYVKNNRDFNLYGQSANTLQQLPEKNEIVLVRWHSHFVRGLVLNSINKEKVRVALCDIGGITYQPLSDLREISDDLLGRKRYNFKIMLDNIRSIGEKETQILLNFVREKTVFRLQFDEDTFQSGKNVKLFEKSSGTALDKLLRSLSTSATIQMTTKAKSLQQTTIHLETKEPSESTRSPQPNDSVKPTQSVEPHQHLEKEERMKPLELIPNPELTSTTKTFISDLSLETLPENVADILVLDTSTIAVGCISVIELKNVDKLDQIRQRIKDIVNDLLEDYDPENNEVCLAKFAEDQEWYRAEYISECNQFCFIDYGNYSSVQRKDVRKLPLSLKDPCYTVLCHIDNFKKLSVEGTGKLTEFLLQNQIQKGCKVKRALSEDDEEEVYVTLQTI